MNRFFKCFSRAGFLFKRNPFMRSSYYPYRLFSSSNKNSFESHDKSPDEVLEAMQSKYSEGIQHTQRGEYPKALEKHLQALDICKANLGEDNLRAAIIYNAVGDTYRMLRRLDKAEEN